jgi:hypothetical protein
LLPPIGIIVTWSSILLPLLVWICNTHLPNHGFAILNEAPTPLMLADHPLKNFHYKPGIHQMNLEAVNADKLYCRLLLRLFRKRNKLIAMTVGVG